MTTQAEAFLVLEKSLSDRLSRQWAVQSARINTQIIEAVDARQFAYAHELVAQYSQALISITERNQRYIEFIGMQATLFGASRLTQGKPSQTMFAGDDAEKPEEVTTSSEAIAEMIGRNGGEDVMRSAHRMIDREEADQQDEAYKSDAELRRKSTEGFVRAFQSSVRSNGEAFINIGSSLHTSRLGAWGFTQEAQFRNITEYQVSEQLDSRTCPVCRAMHGRKFTVGPAAAKLQSWLGVKDLNQMSSIAPWPRQDKKSVQSLLSMPNSKIRENGWDTPPYHPLCRGILVESGALPVKQPIRPQDVERVVEPEVLVAEITQEEFKDAAAFMNIDADDMGKMRITIDNRGYKTPAERVAEARISAAANEPAIKAALDSIDTDTVLDGLDAAEKAAVFQYMHTTYRKINKHLRGEIPKNGGDVYGDWLDSGLSKLPAHEGTLYRGMRVDADLADDVLKMYSPGTIVEEKAFLSTSMSAYKAADFSNVSSFGAGTHVGINFVIKANGKRGNVVISASEFPDEFEVVFRKNTKFRVLEVEDQPTLAQISSARAGEARITIYLEEVI